MNWARFRRRRLRFSIRANPVVLGSDALMHADDKLKTEAARENCGRGVEAEENPFGCVQNGSEKTGLDATLPTQLPTHGRIFST